MNPRITLHQVDKDWIVNLDGKEQWRGHGEYAKTNVEEYARWLTVELTRENPPSTP